MGGGGNSGNGPSYRPAIGSDYSVLCYDALEFHIDMAG